LPDMTYTSDWPDAFGTMAMAGRMAGSGEVRRVIQVLDVVACAEVRGSGSADPVG
jgi:hypothetical protein